MSLPTLMIQKKGGPIWEPGAFAPWDNDSAADWYSEFMEKTKIRSRVMATLKFDAEDHREEIRAAIAVLIMLAEYIGGPLSTTTAI